MNSFRHILNPSSTKQLLSNMGESAGRSDATVVGEEFSLYSSSSNTMGFPEDHPPIPKFFKAVGEKGVSIAGLQIAFISTWGICQKKSMSSKSDSSKPLVSCAPALARTSYLISNVYCCLGVIGIWVKWLSWKNCFRVDNMFQLAENFLGSILFFLVKISYS